VFEESRWLVVILTIIPASVMLLPMRSLHQTGSGKRSARLGRCVPKSEFLSGKLTPDERKSKIVLEIQRLHGQDEPLNIPAVKRRHPELLKAVYESKPFWGWKRALEAAGLDYSKIHTEFQDYIRCRICGRDLGRMGTHLPRIHEVDADDYHLDYPGSDLLSEELRARMFSIKNDIMSHWERCWTPEYILDRLAEFHRRGLPLNTVWLCEHDKRTLAAALYYFGNIRTALSTVGIDPQKVRARRPKYPDAKAVLSGIRHRASAQLPLTAKEMALGEHRNQTLLLSATKHFGCWAAALKAAGIDWAELRQKLLRTQMRYPSPNSVVAEIRRRVGVQLAVMSSHLDKGEHRDLALLKSGKKYFGSWLAALKAAGIDAAELRRESAYRRRRFPDRNSVIAEIQRRVKVLPHVSVWSGKHCDQALRKSAKRLFGSCQAALKASGKGKEAILGACSPHPRR
jgi:hypothetical protein